MTSCYAAALSDQGDAHTVWKSPGSSEPNLRSSTQSATGGWAAPAILETGNLYCPELASNPAGDTFLLFWRDSAPNELWVRRHRAAAGWEPPIAISSDAAGAIDHPDLAVDAQGNAVALWELREADGARIWANRFSTQSGWGRAARLEGAANGSRSPLVVFDSTGLAMAVWSRDEGDRTELWASTLE